MGIKIYNSELINSLREGAKIQVSTDGIPSELAEKVVPVMEVNPRLLKRTNFFRNIDAANSVNVAQFTTSTSGTTFITNISMTLTKDVTAVSTEYNLRCPIDGINQTFFSMGALTLTPEVNSLSINLNNPIKLDQGSGVTLTSGSATGNFHVRGMIMGYIEYNPNA